MLDTYTAAPLPTEMPSHQPEYHTTREDKIKDTIVTVKWPPDEMPPR